MSRPIMILGSIEQLTAPNPEAEAKVRLLAALPEVVSALESMWHQFAYEDGQGKLWHGGLSALEECYSVLNQLGRLDEKGRVKA